MARLSAVVRATAPDVILLHSSKAGLVGRLLVRRRIPTVFAPHAWSFDAVSEPTAAWARSWERLAARWTDAILCVSEDEIEAGRRAGISADFKLARNGVDVALVAELASRGEVLRADLKLDETTKLVVCVGRLVPQKGQDILLRAWSQVSGSHRKRILVIVGGGPQEPELRRLAAGDESIRFVGDVDRASSVAWLGAADLSVVPSRWEGMALVPLESLACGTPVVGSRVTGVTEAISNDVGTLVPPDDPVALAAALETWLAADPQIVAAARQTARARASKDFALSKTIDAVAEILAAATQPGES